MVAAVFGGLIDLFRRLNLDIVRNSRVSRLGRLPLVHSGPQQLDVE